MKKIAIILATVVITACSSVPKVDNAQPKADATEAPKSEVSTPSPAIVPIVTAETESSKLAAEVQRLQKQSVYFDFDQTSIKAEYQGVIQTQADFAKSQKKDVITVEGNADERGSNEYNLALGNRRAEAVKKELELLGVKPTQIKTVSYGSEKPRQVCHEEKCWQENRRADFVHKVD